MVQVDNELEEIRRMLGTDAPQQPKKITFDLDDVMEEIGDVVDKTRATKESIVNDGVQINVKEFVKEESQMPQKKDAKKAATQQQQTMRMDVARSETKKQRNKAQPEQVKEDISLEKPLKKLKRKFGRRGGWELREKARMFEENQEIKPREPQAAARGCVRRMRGMIVRSVAVFAISILLLYMSIANGLGLPIAQSIDFAQSTRSAVLVMVILQVAAMLISIDVVGAGFYNMVQGKAERASLVTCACMASLLHAMCLLLVSWAPYLPYCGISTLLLFFSLIEELNRNAGRARAFRLVAQNQSTIGVIVHSDDVDGVRRTVKRKNEDNIAFLKEMERPDFTEYFARIYVPIALVASVIFSLISCFQRREFTSFFWTLSAILSMTSPLPLVCAFGCAYANASRKLSDEGAAIASGRSAFAINRIREVVLRDRDLFPAGSIQVKEVRAEGTYKPEKIMAYAASVAEACELAMASTLASSQEEQFGRPFQAQNPETYDSGGVSAYVTGDTVLMGTAAFMSRMGITLLDPTRAEGVVLYVAINGQIAGAIFMSYHPSSQTYHSMQALARLHIHPVLAQRDCNISAAMVERLFEVKRGTVGEMSADRVRTVLSQEYGKQEPVGAILARDGLVGLAQVHMTADRLACAVRSNLILGAFGGLCGGLLMFYLTALSSFETIIPLNVLIYMAMWYIPSFFVTLHTKNGL